MSRILPILFNTDMVRAILNGEKTVTRRICKDANDYNVPDMEFYDANKRTYAIHSYADKGHMDKLSIVERTCPICPEDILYVRETWNWNPLHEYGTEENKYIYKAGYDEHAGEVGWRPSIHMPKEAARIWLKVTDVRVERLQDITIESIRDEGLLSLAVHAGDMDIATQEWSILWNSTIKKSNLDRYGWTGNPWVWVIEFERCEKPNIRLVNRKRTDENNKMTKWLEGMRKI